MFALRNFLRSAEGIIAPEEPQENTSQSEPAYGFRVIHVDQSSSASEAGLEALFDYIVGINGRPLTVVEQQPDIVHTTAVEVAPPIEEFVTEVCNCGGKSVSFEVWSAKGRVTRTVMIEIPQVDSQHLLAQLSSDLADAHMAIDSSSVGLGATLQWTPLSAADHVWHVLNVAPNSPAEEAGLISHADYIVGAENGLLATGGESLLGRVVSSIVASHPNSDPEIELYVYNHDYDNLRPVRIRPNPHWGGTGLLGCGVGYGLLHRLPMVVGKFDQSHRRRSSSIYRRNDPNYNGHHSSSLMPPGGTLFEAEPTQDVDADTSNFITPASLDQAAPHLSPGPPPKSKKQHRRGSNANNDLSQYFAEEEKRSRELEGRKDSPATNIPPPPKAT
uniref:ARAD1C13112p n=1 Tax=Blastobotrys adeninivorans TaxID=409370 RepID=A0A060T012_BLAAD